MQMQENQRRQLQKLQLQQLQQVIICVLLKAKLKC